MELTLKRVVWITGGSRGIGRAAAVFLAKMGCNIAVGYKANQQMADDLVEELTSIGCQALAVQVDVADVASVAQAHKQIKDTLGPVEVLVNSAGVVRDNLFLMLNEDDWRDVIDTNLLGTVNASKAVIRDMMMKRWGRIINISSVAGTKGGRGQSNYAATKGAVEALTRSLAVELCSRNITVNAIAPGVIETDMSSQVRKLAHDEIMNRQLIKRYGTPEEIAAWIGFVASDYSSYLTGQTILLDGGLKMP